MGGSLQIYKTTAMSIVQISNRRVKIVYLSGYLNGLGTLSRSGVLMGELRRTIVGRFSGGVFGSAATTIFSAPSSFIGNFGTTVSWRDSLMGDLGTTVSLVPSIDEIIVIAEII